MNEIEHLEMHSFDRTRHGGFVAVSCSKSLRISESRLRRIMNGYRDSRLLVATAVGEPDLLLGWIAVAPMHNRIIACYVKYGFRGTHGGEFRVGSSMAIAAGISFERPVLCSLWSRAAKRIAGKPGNPYRLAYRPDFRRAGEP